MPILPGILLTPSLALFSGLRGPQGFCLEASQTFTSWGVGLESDGSPYPWIQAALVSFQSSQCTQPSPLSGLS